MGTKRDPFIDKMFPQGAGAATKAPARSDRVAQSAPIPAPVARPAIRPYLGIGGWLASCSMNANGPGINADLSGDGVSVAGSVIGGVDLPVTDALNVALEADYTAGEIGIARFAFYNVTGSAKLRHSWSVSVVPSIALDAKWRGFVRLGAGRASA